MKGSQRMLCKLVEFDTNGTEAANAIAKHLVRHGWASQIDTTTAACGEGTQPPIPLVHPYCAAVQVAGASGSAALSMMSNKTAFSLGTNGGGSNRISAGLLGLSGLFCGGTMAPVYGDSIGTIALTPFYNALIMNALLETPSKLPDMIRRRDNEELPHDTRIGWLSTFAPEFVEGEERYAFPGFDASSLPNMPIHASVDMSFHMFPPRLQRQHVSMTPLNGLIREFSHTRFFKWMKQAAVARKRFVASDPYGIPLADFEAILASAEAWSGDKRMEEIDVHEKRREEHRRAASELPVDYILTPLLRIPYWKTPGPDRKNPMFTAENTNPAVPFLPTCMGKGPKGDALEILDPTFNPYSILAEVWGTPSVTIPVAMSAPHPIRKEWGMVLFSLLLTKVPRDCKKGMKDTATQEDALKTLVEMMLVASKLSNLMCD